MEIFAATVSQTVLNWELDAISSLMLSPAGSDIEEKTLTGLDFNNLISRMGSMAPTLWESLQDLAYTPAHKARNSAKNPEEVSIPSSR